MLWRKSIRWRVLADRFSRPSIRTIIDVVDIIAIFIVLIVAPPRARQRWQILRALITLVSLSVVALWLIALHSPLANIIAATIALFIAFSSLAFARVGSVTDSAIEKKFFGVSGDEQPDVPEYGYTILFVAVFLFVAFPLMVIVGNKFG